MISLVSLVGIVTIFMKEARLQRILFLFVGLAVGGLFGDAFLHLLPEAYAKPDESIISSFSILAGILTFFILEKFLRWRHRHNVEKKGAVTPLGYLNLIADSAHNLIDGVLVGSSYLVSRPMGIATTLAVLLHEIPQEIGDFGILLQSGFSRKKALVVNFATASLAVVGAMIALSIGEEVKAFSDFIMPFTAGGFIYIAGSDLLPELHEELDPGKSLVQLLAISVGIALMWSLTLLES